VRQKGLQKRIGYILAPLAVAPAWQKRGIGSALVKGGLSRFELQEDGIVFVYGDPGYYQRFGFSRELAENFLPPYPPRYPSGWQALKLDARKLPDAPVSIECVGALCLPMIW
jgi:putative acetyltransferase